MLRGAIIGCGFFAQNHLHAWGDVDGAELVAVCDLDGEKAAAAAKKFSVPRHYSDASEMLNEESLEFVDVATTMPTHRALIELAAANGVPAICQKPFAPTIEDVRAMVEACRAVNVPLMVHENFRWQTPLMAVKEVLDSGSVGTPFFGRVSMRTGFNIYGNQPYLAEEERFIILDLGIHLLDVARFLFGEAKHLACHTASANQIVRAEDTATILLGHKRNVAAFVDCSYFSKTDPDPFPETLVEIDATEGSIRLLQGYRMTVVTPKGTETRDVSPRLLPWAEKPWHCIQESVLNIQQHWIDCLNDGRETDTSGADNLRTFALAEAAYESAGSGRTIEITQ